MNISWDNITAWLPDMRTTVVNRFLPFLLILIAGIFIIKIVMKIVNKALSKSKMEKAAHSLIKSLIRAVLALLLGLIAASTLGIDVTGVIALASVLTLAISLSVQNLLTNIIGGDRKSTRLNSSHNCRSRMPSSA